MASGRAKPGIRDVASLAGVALSSVSRVMNGHPDVSDDMRERVMAAVEKLGYQRDLVASGLRRGSTRTVGLVVSDIANPLFSQIAKGAGAVFQEAGYSLVLTNSDSDPSRDLESIQVLQQRRVDGLVLALSDETSSALAAALGGTEAPIVLLDRRVHSIPDASAVLSDHRQGMRAAVEHLHAHGHERIVLLIGPGDIRPNREREDAFKEAISHAGLSADSAVVVGPGLTSSFGQHAAAEALAVGSSRPTAIIAGGNLVLVGVLQALREAGIRPGQDIALISCDDVPVAELHEPPISVISRDTVGMGRAAAQLLLDRIEGDEPAGQTVTLPTGLVVRDSSRLSLTG